jgi:two-component system chemotaxis response regulator CheB
MKKAGGLSLVQDPEEAAHPWMPLTALMRDHVDLVLRLDEIVPVLLTLADGRPVDQQPTAVSG